MEQFERIVGDRTDQYTQVLAAIEALIRQESDPIANMANISAILKQQFEWLWIGFYRVCGDELILGPYQGPLACTRIPKGKGVCGQAWERNEILLVPDVHSFPGHIACNTLSRSEIVVPICKAEEVRAVLDVDSSLPAGFDAVDQHHLAQLGRLLGPLL